MNEELRLRWVAKIATRLRIETDRSTAESQLKAKIANGEAYTADLKGVPWEQIVTLFDEAEEAVNGEAPKTPKPTPPEPVANFDDDIIARLNEMDAELKILDITDDHLNTLEFWIKARITDRSLNALNTSFTKLRRRKLSYRDMAAIGMVHRRSVQENDGYSNYKRFIVLSQQDDRLFGSPIYDCHVARTLEVFNLLGYTKRIAKHDPKNHLCARYTITEVEGLD